MKTVAFLRFPDNSFMSTNRDIAGCGTWRENSEYIWRYDKPQYKFKIVYQGPPNPAENVRRCFDAALKAEGCVQKPLKPLLDQ